MTWPTLIVAVAGSTAFGSAVTALIGRPKMRADSAKVMVETATELLDPLREEVHRLANELAAARQTIATQQQTIAEQQRVAAQALSARGEADRRVRDLELHVTRLEAMVRALGGDPSELARQLGARSASPSGIPTV